MIEGWPLSALLSKEADVSVGFAEFSELFSVPSAVLLPPELPTISESVADSLTTASTDALLCRPVWRLCTVDWLGK